MDPKALILLVLSAFAVIILAIGAGMGQDYRSRESTNSTAEASMNRFSTAEGANIYSSTSEASITSTFASENANPHIEINTECIKFFTEYDQRNCSYNYNSDDCYSIQLPEDNKLTDLDREELNGIRRKYPNVLSLFHYLRLREDDAQFVNLFVMPDQSESRSGYFKQLDYVVDIIHELDSSFNRTGCWYRPPNATEFFDNELETLLQGRETFALSMLKNISKVSWNEFNVPLKDRLIRFIIQIGFSLDISIKDCWEDYVSKNPNIVNSPYHELCSPGKRLGIDLKETFLNNTSTQSHVRPKRDLPGKKPRNNANISEFGDAQVLKKKQDDLGKSKEAPKRPMHAGKSYEKMRGNGYLLRSRKGLAIKNSNKIPF